MQWFRNIFCSKNTSSNPFTFKKIKINSSFSTIHIHKNKQTKNCFKHLMCPGSCHYSLKLWEKVLPVNMLLYLNNVYSVPFSFQGVVIFFYPPDWGFIKKDGGRDFIFESWLKLFRQAEHIILQLKKILWEIKITIRAPTYRF